MPISYFFDPNETVVLNETFTFSHTGATPQIFWIFIAIAAIVLFICAFVHKIRDDNGKVSTERVAFSLFGAVSNGFAAYLSLVIDISNGVGTAATETYHVYSVAMHTLYEGGLVPVFFVVIGLICFANFIYTLMQPELLKPDTGEMKGGTEGKVKAEE